MFGECGYVQLINEFVEKEGILVDGDWQVEVLLGETRDQVEMLCFKQLNRHEQGFKLQSQFLGVP